MVLERPSEEFALLEVPHRHIEQVQGKDSQVGVVALQPLFEESDVASYPQLL